MGNWPGKELIKFGMARTLALASLVAVAAQQEPCGDYPNHPFASFVAIGFPTECHDAIPAIAPVAGSLEILCGMAIPDFQQGAGTVGISWTPASGAWETVGDVCPATCLSSGFPTEACAPNPCADYKSEPFAAFASLEIPADCSGGIPVLADWNATGGAGTLCTMAISDFQKEASSVGWVPAMASWSTIADACPTTCAELG